MAESKMMVKKEVDFFKKKGAPPAMIKHEQAEAKGMKKGGMPMKGGKPAFMKKMAAGGVARADGVATKGHTKGKQIVMKRGGKC